MSPPRNDPLRPAQPPQSDAHHYTTAASAPYVATLWLRGGLRLTIALPGMGDHVLTGCRGDRGPSRLITVPEPTAASDARAHPATLGARAGLGRSIEGLGLSLRLEKGLGDGTGLGADGAAWLAAALSVAAWAGEAPDTAGLIEAAQTDLGATAPLRGGWQAVVATGLRGGLWFGQPDAPAPQAWTVDLGVIAVMPGEAHGRLPIPEPAAPDPGALRAARQGDLEALQAVLVQPETLHPAWERAFEAARDAGAVCTAVAAGGTSIIALCPHFGQARAVRGAAVAAFGEAGVWSRARSGRPGPAARWWSLDTAAPTGPPPEAGPAGGPAQP